MPARSRARAPDHRQRHDRSVCLRPPVAPGRAGRSLASRRSACSTSAPSARAHQCQRVYLHLAAECPPPCARQADDWSRTRGCSSARRAHGIDRKVTKTADATWLINKLFDRNLGQDIPADVAPVTAYASAGNATTTSTKHSSASPPASSPGDTSHDFVRTLSPVKVPRRVRRRRDPQGAAQRRGAAASPRRAAPPARERPIRGVTPTNYSRGGFQHPYDQWPLDNHHHRVRRTRRCAGTPAPGHLGVHPGAPPARTSTRASRPRRAARSLPPTDQTSSPERHPPFTHRTRSRSSSVVSCSARSSGSDTASGASGPRLTAPAWGCGPPARQRLASYWHSRVPLASHARKPTTSCRALPQPTAYTAATSPRWGVSTTAAACAAATCDSGGVDALTSG
jgi:hypothetical protein